MSTIHMYIIYTCIWHQYVLSNSKFKECTVNLLSHMVIPMSLQGIHTMRGHCDYGDSTTLCKRRWHPKLTSFVQGGWKGRALIPILCLYMSIKRGIFVDCSLYWHTEVWIFPKQHVPGKCTLSIRERPHPESSNALHDYCSGMNGWYLSPDVWYQWSSLDTQRSVRYIFNTWNRIPIHQTLILWKVRIQPNTAITNNECLHSFIDLSNTSGEITIHSVAIQAAAKCKYNILLANIQATQFLNIHDWNIALFSMALLSRTPPSHGGRHGVGGFWYTFVVPMCVQDVFHHDQQFMIFQPVLQNTTRTTHNNISEHAFLNMSYRSCKLAKTDWYQDIKRMVSILAPNTIHSFLT